MLVYVHAGFPILVAVAHLHKILLFFTVDFHVELQSGRPLARLRSQRLHSSENPNTGTVRVSWIVWY